MNLSRKCGNLLSRVDGSRRFAMAVASNDVPRLQSIVRLALKKGASISTITAKIQEAMDGTYHARGYNATDIDIALMCLRLGGRRLLYGMNHHTSVPSLRTLRRRHAFTKLVPSIGKPTTETIMANIAAVLGPKAELLELLSLSTSLPMPPAPLQAPVSVPIPLPASNPIPSSTTHSPDNSQTPTIVLQPDVAVPPITASSAFVPPPLPKPLRPFTTGNHVG